MKRLILILALAFGLISTSQAEIPVIVRSSTSNAETATLITALKALINGHPDYRVTTDTSETHVVINVSAVSNSDSVAFVGAMELRPPEASMGITVRAPLVLTTIAESTAMLLTFYHNLLIEDKMVNKLLYIRRVQIPSGDLNELARLILAARAAAERGRI